MLRVECLLDHLMCPYPDVLPRPCQRQLYLTLQFTLSIKWHKCATQCTDEILTSSIKRWKLLIPTAVERVRTEGELEQRYKPPLVVVTQCRSRSAAVYRSSSLRNSPPPRTSWHLIKTKSQLSHKHANMTTNRR